MECRSTFPLDNESCVIYKKNLLVAVGSVVNLLIHPVGALSIGTAAGALSVAGYRYLSVKFFNYFNQCNLLQLILFLSILLDDLFTV